MRQRYTSRQIRYTHHVGIKESILKFWRLNSRLFPHWSPSWGLYLILVWGFALIRSNYLWITGDDPNLIAQAALTHSGLKPNLDFESGYPGLSQFFQADLMHIFGVNVFSQHLYTALLASLTGLLICVNFPNLPQWLLSLGLTLVYCQQHLVNPTPNPGHLFEIFLLIIFTIINKKVVRSNKSIFYFSFVFMGVAFLSKQYAIFLLVGYTISQFENAKWAISDFKKNLILMCMGLTAASSYYLLLIPNGPLKGRAVMSLVAMVLPFVVLVWVNARVQPNNSPQSLAHAARNAVLGATIFFFTVTIGLAGLYQSFHLPHIFYKVLIEAPRKINNNTVLLSLSGESLKSVVAFFVFAICTMCLFFSQYSEKPKKLRLFVFESLTILIGILAFAKIGNLSGSIFLFLFPIAVTLAYFYKSETILFSRKQFFFVMTCYQFVLIPYPNVNFHIMIFVVAAFILISDKFEKVTSTRSYHLWAFPIALVSLLLIHEAKTIDALDTYTFQEVNFKSADAEWGLAINDAENANRDLSVCKTLGCKMLLLVAEG